MKVGGLASRHTSSFHIIMDNCESEQVRIVSIKNKNRYLFISYENSKISLFSCCLFDLLFVTLIFYFIELERDLVFLRELTLNHWGLRIPE